MFGCFIGGWCGDRFGRKRGTLIGASLCLLGGALMSASHDANMFICARVIAGLGIGFINVIIPPWVSELSQAHNRGSNFSLVFVANFLGIILAYWINFAVRETEVEFRWRFPLGIMCVPVLLIVATVAFLPDSPRWLISMHRDEEATEVLAKVRGDLALDDPRLVEEVEVLRAQVESSKLKRNSLFNMVIGRYSGDLHLGRRVWLGFWLQQIQQWTGILAIATWAGTLFTLAGFDPYKSAWLAGLVNTFGVVGTAAAALVIDRLGRVKSLLVSFITQGISLFLVAAFIHTSQQSTGDKSTNFGVAAAAMVFVFLWFFTMFNIVPCWIYGTEIWPQEIRAKGYSFTILGWAVGCGMNTFVIPIMLDRLGWLTFIVFGIFNIVAMPVIWLIYPEVAGKSLEEVNLLFMSDSILASKNQAAYERLLAECDGDLAAAGRRLMNKVDEQFPDVLAAHHVAEEGKANTTTVEMSSHSSQEKRGLN
jgi:sugar porter (SP) family MFS transporter